jgi:hypothetical protein
MFTTTRVLKVSAVIALLACGACAQTSGKSGEVTPESQGFRWVGQGESTNFGADYNYCRNVIGYTAGTRYDTSVIGSREEARQSNADKRRFWDCMQGRGWGVSN